MMIMTLDKGLATERVAKIDHLYEHPLDGILNGTYSTYIDDPKDFPDISKFHSSDSFETIEVVDDDNMRIPICEGYDTIRDVSGNYDGNNKYYNFSIVIGFGKAN